LLIKTESETTQNPEWFKFDTTDIFMYREADTAKQMVVSGKEITDQGEKWCKMKVRGVNVPDEFLAAGYQIENHCCVQFKDNGKPVTLCNVNRPRCWRDMRMFARLIRRHCIVSKHGANDPAQMLRDEK